MRRCDRANTGGAREALSRVRREVAVDGSEIAEASWFPRDGLPILPPRISIARRLIDAWRAGPA